MGGNFDRSFIVKHAVQELYYDGFSEVLTRVLHNHFKTDNPTYSQDPSWSLSAGYFRLSEPTFWSFLAGYFILSEPTYCVKHASSWYYFRIAQSCLSRTLPSNRSIGRLSLNVEHILYIRSGLRLISSNLCLVVFPLKFCYRIAPKE